MCSYWTGNSRDAIAFWLYNSKQVQNPDKFQNHSLKIFIFENFCINVNQVLIFLQGLAVAHKFECGKPVFTLTTVHVVKNNFYMTFDQAKLFVRPLSKLRLLDLIENKTMRNSSMKFSNINVFLWFSGRVTPVSLKKANFYFQDLFLG